MSAPLCLSRDMGGYRSRPFDYCWDAELVECRDDAILRLLHGVGGLDALLDHLPHHVGEDVTVVRLLPRGAGACGKCRPVFVVIGSGCSTTWREAAKTGSPFK